MSEKLSDHKSMSSSQLRRINKPLMEKKRRARINTCLVQLKSLVLEAMKKDPSRYSKLEKADILEMTVKHLRDIQRDRLAAAASTDPSVLTKYRTGFTECAKEVTRYLGNMDGIPTDVRGRLVEHLSGCVHGMNTASAAHAGSVLPPGSRMPMQPIHVQIPTTTPLGSLPGGPQHMHPLMTSLSSSTSPIQTVLTSEGTQIQGTFQIMPGVYPGSNSITVFVPSSQTSHPTSFSTGSSPRSPMSDISPCSSPEPGRITPEHRPSEFQPRPVKPSPENRPPIRESAKHNIAQMLNNKMDTGKDKDVWRPW